MKQVLNFPGVTEAPHRGASEKEQNLAQHLMIQKNVPDDETPWINHLPAICVFQADYKFMHADWGLAPCDGRANINTARLSAGIVIHAGSVTAPAHIQ
jgi:hypothetical protein